jgi:glycosyltransferase involved in cell wall biosynthesis
MHYHESTFRAIEKRLESEGGTFIVVSGHPKQNESGRVAVSNAVVKQHFFIPYHEWRFRTYTLRWQPTLANTVRRIKPNLAIVAGHVGDVTYWRLGLSRQRRNLKYMTWQCGYEYNLGGIKNLITRNFLKHYDYHLAYHTAAKNYLLSHGVPTSRITVIHNTINERDIALSPRDGARKAITAKLGIPENRPIILFVGAILAEKRLDILLQAVRFLGPTTASLVIVGDGPALATLKSASEDLNYVKYTGRVVADVGRFFDAADVFVLPGTGGLAINEAMAHRLPVISAYADGSAADLVTDGVNGYVLKKANAEEVAHYLRILLNNSEARLRMGEASRERITTKYSFTAFIDRIMGGIHAAMNSAPHR